MNFQDQISEAITDIGALILVSIIKAIRQSFSKKKTEIIIVGFFDDDGPVRKSSSKKRKQAERGRERATDVNCHKQKNRLPF